MLASVFCILMLAHISCSIQENTTKGIDQELIFVNLIWRHGARSSIYTYPSNPWNGKAVWPQGPGQLTQKGMKQQYNLGRYFKNRYKGFLSERYNRSEIYIRSTDVDRTLMSAECNMAGLYPPEGKQKWNGSGTIWQPFPIHTQPTDTDFLLRFPIPNCPKYVELQSQIAQTPEYKALKEKYKDFLTKLANFTAWNGTMNMMQAWDVEDALTCERAQGLKLPLWATSKLLNKLAEISAIDIGVMFGAINSKYQTQVARVGAGMLVKQILANIQKSIYDQNNNKSTCKVVAYSAHDTTLTALLTALDAFNMQYPPFASSVIFEVYKKNINLTSPQYIVKAFYRNSTLVKPFQLNLLGCDLDCPLEELQHRAAVIISDDVHAECHSTQATVTIVTLSSKDYIIPLLYVVTALLLLTWLILFGVICSKNWVRKNSSYLHSYEPLDFDEAGKD